MRPALRLLTSGSAALAAALVFAACGGGGGDTNNVAQRAAATAATAPAPAPAPTRIHIVSPRPGSHTGATVVVSERLTGAQPAGSPLLRYILDGHLARTGPTRVTLHGLAPGRHRLEVLLVGDAAVRSASVFTVRAPAAPVAPVPAPAPETMAHEQAPPPTMGRSESHQEAPPSPKKEAPPSPKQEAPPSQKTEATPPAPAEGGIPQGGGGDHDGDNSGGPSDGDGNI